MYNWPTKLADDINEFTAAKLDPDTIPELKVVTFSNLFKQGGNVQVRATGATTTAEGEKKPYELTLAEITIDADGDVTRERQHLQDLLEDWNADAESNWRELINNSRQYIRNYYLKQVAENTAKLEKADAGIWS